MAIDPEAWGPVLHRAVGQSAGANPAAGARP